MSHARPLPRSVEPLVTTDWVDQRLDDPAVRLIEVDVDTRAFELGHVPGAVAFNWQDELQDELRRDIVDRKGFEALARRVGLRRDDHVVLYGDNNNWFAAYGFWLFKLYGHRRLSLMDGGRKKWVSEDRELTQTVSDVAPSTYVAESADSRYRATLAEALDASAARNTHLVDVRSGEEFRGEIIAPPGMSETAQRGGHIPSARNVPWASAVAENGTIRSREELKRIYFAEAGLDPATPTITYCRIGERSSHTWFVLRYVLGLEDVKNYDGSWTEYGNLVGVPIAR